MRIASHIALGVVWALSIGVLGGIFGTTGDGWVSGLYSAFSSFIGAPVASLAWASPRKVVTHTCSYMAILIGLGTDLFLYFNTLEEGPRLFHYVWEKRPLLLVVWFLLFAGWQVAAICALIRRSSRQALRADSTLQMVG